MKKYSGCVYQSPLISAKSTWSKQRISASSSHASDSGSRCRKRLMRRGLDSIGMTFKLRPVED